MPLRACRLLQVLYLDHLVDVQHRVDIQHDLVRAAMEVAAALAMPQSATRSGERQSHEPVSRVGFTCLATYRLPCQISGERDAQACIRRRAIPRSRIGAVDCWHHQPPVRLANRLACPRAEDTRPRNEEWPLGPVRRKRRGREQSERRFLYGL